MHPARQAYVEEDHDEVSYQTRPAFACDHTVFTHMSTSRRRSSAIVATNARLDKELMSVARQDTNMGGIDLTNIRKCSSTAVSLPR